MSWIMTHLYEVTKNPEHLKKAIEIWQKEIGSASERNMVNRIAELYWEIAKAQDMLGEHLDATESFKLASENYSKTAEEIPHLRDFYEEYASYMLAWSEFEKAKQCHAEKRFLQALEHYKNTAEIYKSTERWSYLAPNYLAWARLEEAEDLSRKEQTQEAIKLFEEAKKLFEETKRTLESKLESIQSREHETMELLKQATDILEGEKEPIELKPELIQDEKTKGSLVSLINASEVRRDYCLGRIALEEAITLDQRGDTIASSRAYASAADIFESIAGISEEASGELQPLVWLCRAWQNMTKAKAEDAPELYLEAARQFDEARVQCTDERSRRLVQGHSSFCKALEAGTRFEETQDQVHYSEARKHLVSAANLYVRAGFNGASEYAKATQRFFDAHVYMEKAGIELDPQEKARYYMMTERLLESSARSYLAANYPEKSKEVERLLGRVREEREMASSLSEVLLTPMLVSPAESFTVPMPTREQAVGLERFENADMETNLILGKREIRIGEEIDLEIEMTNTGKVPAQLMMVEDMIPEGFSVVSAPDFCRIEGSSINLKRRALPPLKMEEVKLVMKPREKGDFHLKPKILYFDENGNFNTHEPELVTIIVKELGISGWLRGPRRETRPKK
jgi:uncharacterized repeat protein (TIGR01451 family)